MKFKLVEIKFCFPRISSKVKSKQEFVQLLIEMMRKDGSIKHAGYLKEKILYKDLLQHLGSGEDISQYRELSMQEKQDIEKTIYATILKCHQKLPLPTKNFIFIFPWFPTKEDRIFKGSMGVATYSCVFYVFIAPQKFTNKSLVNTIVHELNHTIFYYHHYNRFGQYTLLDNLIMEGLAENFREEIVDKKQAPWAIALKKKEAFDVLNSITSLLHSKSSSVYQRIFFGDGKYKRWTGYSIGYWLVKEFRKKQAKLSWEEIMQVKPKDILETVIN